MKRSKRILALLLALVLALSLAPLTALADPPKDGCKDGKEHKWVLLSDSAACTKDGTRLWRCSQCGSNYREASPALGHDWNEGQVLEDEHFPGGKKLHFWCLRCGETKDEALPVNEDAPDDYGWEPPEDEEIPDGAVSPASGEPADNVLVLVDNHTDFYGMLGSDVELRTTLVNSGDVKLYDPVIDLYRWDKSAGDFAFFMTLYSSDACLQAKGGDKFIDKTYFITDWDLENAEDGLAQIALKARARTKEGMEVKAEPLVFTYPVFDVSVHLETEDTSAGQIPVDGWVKVKLKVSCQGTETLKFAGTDLWVHDPDGATIGYTEDCELHNYDMSWFVPGSTEEAEIWIKVNHWDLEYKGVHRSLALYYERLVREDHKTVFPSTPMAEVVGTDWMDFMTNKVEIVVPLLEPPEEPAPAPEPRSFCEPALTGLGEGTEAWTLTRCGTHAATALAAEEAAPEEALALWTEALDAEYEAYLTQADETLRPAIEAERAAFGEQLEACRAAWARLGGEDYALAKAAELVMHKCSLLCFARQASPEDWAALLSGAEALPELAEEPGRCLRQTRDLGLRLETRELFCPEHRSIETLAADAEGGRRVKLTWLQALNAETDERYLAEDEEGRALIRDARQSFGRWLTAEETLLSLQHPEDPALVQQLLALTIRDRAMAWE